MKKANQGAVLFATLDTWLLWKLTKGYTILLRLLLDSHEMYGTLCRQNAVLS